MKEMNLTEMSVNEMEFTMGGCGWCSAVDVAAECVKALIHALK